MEKINDALRNYLLGAELTPAEKELLFDSEGSFFEETLKQPDSSTHFTGLQTEDSTIFEMSVQVPAENSTVIESLKQQLRSCKKVIDCQKSKISDLECRLNDV